MRQFSTRRLKESLKHASRWFTIRIQSGPLAGMKWIASSGQRYLKGDYESGNTAVIQSMVSPGQTTYDIGGHVGYFSIMLAKLVGDRGRVFCFEPRPLNITFIKRHLSINQVNNVTLVESAVSDYVGTANFESRIGTGMGHLSTAGNLSVQTTAIDTLVEQSGYPAPDFIKVDIEGGEIAAISGARKTIAKHRPRMLVCIHGTPEHDFVVDFLKQHQYDFKMLEGTADILAWPRKNAA